ncbi:MAG: DUF2782 domain-containing protein [Methylotenera sp.]|nr:DUF2782 domain-containing protein [Methylotenera sp.]
MRKSYKNIASLLMAAMLLPALAQARDLPSNLEPLEDIPPPSISTEENADEPVITIIKKENETIEEYRVGGQLYMLKITPKHGVPYYMHREDQEGAWINDGPNPPLSVPKWTIFTF